jgi:hypothetical protein
MALRNDDRARFSRRGAGLLAGAVVVGSLAVTGCSSTDVIQTVFGPAAPQARKIVSCESEWNTNAVSPTNDHGLFQINIVHKANFTKVTGQPWSAIYNPLYNTVYAKWLYDREGWEPWSCKRVL